MQTSSLRALAGTNVANKHRLSGNRGNCVLAIYHCSLKVFSRSKGHSAVAAAAYRSGVRLKDERSGAIHRYEKRRGIKNTFILTPNNAPEKYQSRAVLWNAAEASETRKNSCVARELVLALPHELPAGDRHALTQDMALWLMERYRVAVDAAIHAPLKSDGHDHRNHHAHLLFSTRELGEDGFGQKTRILDDKKTGKEETELIREVWETLANDALARAGFEDIRIDRRTLDAQGIDRVPGTHIGPGGAHVNPDQLNEEYEEEDDQDEESEEGKTGSKSGAGGGSSSSSDDPISLKPEGSSKEELKERKPDYKAIDQGRSRRDFVAEIAVLNERRAGFSEVPLRKQIEEIDQLIEALDNRVAHLESLKSKISVPARIVRSISKALEFSKEMLVSRESVRAALKLTDQEKELRKTRQQKRYGRTYRAGLHLTNDVGSESPRPAY